MDLFRLGNLKVTINEEINKGLIAGASLRIFHKNETVFNDTFGLANLETGDPITKDTIFRMHSMSKPITAVAAMILFERGQLNPCTPVSYYLEGFKDQKVVTTNGLVPAKREVSIQDLLNMTSGVVYPEDTEVGRLMGALYDEIGKAHHSGNPISTVEFCNRMGKIPLAFQPGESWCYGASADIVGAIIEIITGKKYRQFLMDEIFEPLNMKDTDFYVPEDKRCRFAQIYDYKYDLKKLLPFTDDFLAIFDYMNPPAFESGGAGLVSTIEDYSHFAIMLVNGGSYQGKRIIGRKTVEYIATPQLTKEQLTAYNWDSQRGYSYGNLCRSMVDTAKAASNGSVGEFGWDGWCGNYLFVDPKEELVMIYMVQRCGGSGWDYMQRLRNIVYGSL